MRRTVRQLRVGQRVVIDGRVYVIEMIERTSTGGYSITCERGPTLNRPGGAKIETLAGRS